MSMHVCHFETTASVRSIVSGVTVSDNDLSATKHTTIEIIEVQPWMNITRQTIIY